MSRRVEAFTERHMRQKTRETLSISGIAPVKLNGLDINCYDLDFKCVCCLRITDSSCTITSQVIFC